MTGAIRKKNTGKTYETLRISIYNVRRKLKKSLTLPRWSTKAFK